MQPARVLPRDPGCTPTKERLAAAVSYEHKIDIPTEDGTGTEKVTLVFKRALTDLPTGIARRNRGDQEAQMWDTFGWGMEADQLDVLDRVPLSELLGILEAWREHSEKDDEPSPAKTKPSE